MRLKTLDAVLKDIPAPVIIETAKRFTTGEVDGQNTSFAPSVAEFTKEARRVAELKAAIGRPRITWVPKQSERAPFLVAQEKARAKFAGWSVFKENVSFDQFKELSKSKAIPVGATWVAALGTVYVPPASA